MAFTAGELVGLAVALAMALLLAVVVGMVARSRRRRRTRLRRAAQALRGRTLFVSSTRRGWREFSVNNVLPALPAGIELAWWDGASRWSTGARVGIDFPRVAVELLLEARLWGARRPTLVRFTDALPGVVDLHAALLPLKLRTRKRSPEVQGEVTAVLERALAGLAVTASR